MPKEANASRASAAGSDPVAAYPVIRLRHPGQWLSAAIIVLAAVLGARLLATNKNIDWPVVGDTLFSRPILYGVLETLELTFLSMAIAIVLGVLLAVMRLSHNPVLSWVSWLFLWVFRSVPALVQLIFWYNLGLFVPTIALVIPFGPTLASISTNVLISGFTAAILGLSLHFGAYMAEVVRAGLTSVDTGQHEAAQALGMPSTLTLRRIVLPQAMRLIIPPTGNQFLSLLKTTSLVSVIGGGDLLTRVQEIYSHTFKVVELLIVASLWYLLLTSIATVGQYYVERHFSKGKTSESPRRRKRHLRYIRHSSAIEEG